MKKIIFLFLAFITASMAQTDFDAYFHNKALRLDYFHTGNDKTDMYSFDQMYEEPYWGGTKKNLIDPFNYGSYRVMVYDSASNKLIYSRGYSTLFSEWQTTDEAKITQKTFSETVTFPFPKKTVRVELNTWTRARVMEKKFEYYINPGNKFISKEKKKSYPLYKVVESGSSENKVDLIILPDGYSKDEMEKFRRDCDKFAGYLFNSSPFKENKNKFNIMAIEIPSEESGVDIPGDSVWKNTPLGLSFYTFDSERYMMTPDNKAIRNVCSNTPYDQIYILGNTEKYGGGAIYNHYSVCASDNKYGEYIFVHEFGHGFAGLADEYYTSDVAYQNFYPLDVEPADPNVTTLVDFNKKWKNMVEKETPVPTPVEEKYLKKIGAFEGGGYVEKGVYRPSFDCTMKSISVDNFCGVCKEAIIAMINYYTE